MDNLKKLIVIDGNSLLFRAYYATSYGDPSSIMRTKSGIPTNAIFAFSNMLTKILQSFQGGESIFIGFDADSQTFRKAEFDQYKANRKPCPEELCQQFPISRDLLHALNITCYEQSGIEADDICGTIAKIASKEGYQVQIYTSDKDYLQLVEPNITVNLLKKGLSDIDSVTPEHMVEEFGFTPTQIIDYKGLRGDASDNLPGIPGVGEKTAVKLIQEYGDFETIIAAAKDGRIKGKMAQNIIENEKMGRLCYSLATIKTDVELPFTLASLLYEGYEFNKINVFAQTYELKQLMNRLPLSLKKGESNALPEIQVVSKLPSSYNPSEIGLALDEEGSSYHDEDIAGIAFASKESIFYLKKEDLLSDAKAVALLNDPSIKKCLYDGKMARIALKRIGIELQGISFDILLAAYLLDSSLASRPREIFSSFGVDVIAEENNDSLLGLFEVPTHPQTMGRIAFYSLSLHSKAIASLKEVDAYDLYANIEFPLSFVLGDMELEGFPLDKATLEEIGATFREKKEALEKEIYELAGHRFNIASPKQVGELLFNELQLATSKSMSTSVEVLKSLQDKHPIVSKILEHRKYSKLLGTYIDGLIPHIKADGKIHTCFNQAQTTTGRLSSSNPNLQNISTRDEESKTIRKAFFYPEPGKQILSLDYSQIELRILASLSGCSRYIDVFQSGRDVHTETARMIFNVPEGQEVPSLYRRRAKAVNFAIIYGTTAFGLADQIEGTPKEATQIINNFYMAYPEIGEYLDSIVKMVETKGYVTTMFGRRRYLRDITDPNYAKREAAKRAALNAPVQGSAADMIKIAMLKVASFLKEGGYKTKMVLQIHDELLFELDESEADVLVPKLKEIMESAVKLPVTLTAEGGYGPSWYEAKD